MTNQDSSDQRNSNRRPGRLGKIPFLGRRREDARVEPTVSNHQDTDDYPDEREPYHLAPDEQARGREPMFRDRNTDAFEPHDAQPSPPRHDQDYRNAEPNDHRDGRDNSEPRPIPQPIRPISEGGTARNRLASQPHEKPTAMEAGPIDFALPIRIHQTAAHQATVPRAAAP